MRYFDLHCDTITECYVQKAELNKNNLHISIQRAFRFTPWAQVFAMWIPDKIRGAQAKERFDSVYSVFCREMEKNRDRVTFCTNGRELETAFKNGKNAAVLSIEGGAALCGKMEYLSEACKRGVRIITLTWNGQCEIGDGCMVKNAGGLTPFGFEMVRQMNRLNMVVDVSHLSEKGFWDVVSTSQKPFIASHSNSKVICPHPRNLTDEQFLEIVKQRGLVGINFYRYFIKEDGKAKIQDILAHIDRFLSLGGENTLAVGGDLDGSDLPDGMNGIEDAEKLYIEMTNRYGEKTTDQIFFLNASNFLKNNLK